jgi:hypothetical protein
VSVPRWPAALLVMAACARGPDPGDAEAARERERLRQRVDELVQRDPAVARALAHGGDVQVALRSELAAAVVREAARRYLDRVELDLPLEKQVRQTGTIEVGTPFGKMKAGEWTADVTVHRVRGVLAARPPALGVTSANHLSVELPVTVQQADGSATVRFRWDARTLASVVCRDFEVSRTIRGRLIGQEYTLSGGVRLAAGPTSVRAEPVFPNRTFRLKVDLLPDSWRQVREALEEQDKLLKCGMAIDPDQVLPRLSGLLLEGFEIRLPRSLFRAVDLPGSVGGTVRLAGRDVELTFASLALEVTPEALWYSVSVSSRTRGEGAAGS